MHLSRGRLALLCLIVVFSALCFSSPRADDSAKPGEKPAAKPDEKPAAPPAAKPDDIPLSPQEALKRITLPEGFSASLFAGEPDVEQPIAMATDDRGRLWVAECYSYPKWTPGVHDRILIFEDTKGTGHFDKRTVFTEDIAHLSGIMPGFGGLWVCSSPNLLFIPYKDGEDKPSGPPEVVLDGWSVTGGHNMLNGLVWGPDGWLWGMNGITSPSKVGKPGTPDKDRIQMNCGVWRYHPTRKVFEVVCNGTTNPFGLDFDDWGQPFITNCVIGHLFHVIPGAHYKRMFGQDFDTHLYDLIDPSSDHLHWGGGDWTTSRGGQGQHSEAGGGHAHSGALVYLGDNWPDSYRNTIFMCNIHGNRLNNDLLERKGSGYVGRHGKDFLMANDTWFRGVCLQTGPDGGVYVADWNDTGECHSTGVIHRETGRVYKVVYGQPKPQENLDLSKLKDEELVALQLHKNDWQVRHARRLLQERAAASQDMTAVYKLLHKQFDEQTDTTRKLRSLWALYATGGASDEFLIAQLKNPAEEVRHWCVRLLCDANAPSAAALKQFAALAKDDKSALVRLALASALQRMPVADRWPIAVPLAEHAEDAEDHNLPLMLWYGIEPAVAADKTQALQLVTSCKIPAVRRYITRRVASP